MSEPTKYLTPECECPTGFPRACVYCQNITQQSHIATLEAEVGRLRKENERLRQRSCEALDAKTRECEELRIEQKLNISPVTQPTTTTKGE